MAWAGRSIAREPAAAQATPVTAQAEAAIAGATSSQSDDLATVMANHIKVIANQSADRITVKGYRSFDSYANDFAFVSAALHSGSQLRAQSSSAPYSLRAVFPMRSSPIEVSELGPVPGYTHRDVFGDWVYGEPQRTGVTYIPVGVLVEHGPTRAQTGPLVTRAQAIAAAQFAAEIFVPGYGAYTDFRTFVDNPSLVNGAILASNAIDLVPGALIAKGVGEIGVAAFGALRRVCFAAGTLIHTKDGLKPIEQIRVGDRVWSRSEHDVGDASYRTVLEAACTGEKEIWEIAVSTPDGRAETYRATETHPFWSETGGDDGEGGFVAAGDLEVGEQLRLHDGSPAYVTRVAKTDAVEPVYNFSVDGWQTYHVGELGVWVHNICLNEFQRLFPDVSITPEAFKDLKNRLGGVLPNELGGAARYEQMFLRRVLQQGPEGGIDFFSNQGDRTVWVEHLGSIGKPRNIDDFTNSIYRHMTKSADELIIDVTGMSRSHYDRFDGIVEQARLQFMSRGKNGPQIHWIGRK